MTVTSLDEIEVCNIALARIGASPINSIEDPQDDREATCANLFFVTLDSILSEHDWNFARHEKALTLDSDEKPLRTFERAFRLPGDLIAGPFSVYGDDREINIGDFRVFGAHLYASYKTVIVEYRRRPPVTIWPPFFVNLVSNALSAQFSMPERDSTSMASYYDEIAFGPKSMDRRGGLFGTATKLDGQSKPTKSLFKNGDPLTGTRY